MVWNISDNFFGIIVYDSDNYYPIVVESMVKGVVFSILASCLFGVVYYYPVLLNPLSVIDIFCWRLLMSFPAILLLVAIQNQWQTLFDLALRIKNQPCLLIGLIFSSGLLAIQMLIFVWAPLNGHGLSASLGYFLLPITMVICGKLFYKERLSVFQQLAVVCASIGVVIEIYLTGAFSIETAIIALGYPLYFMIRRKLRIEGIAGIFSDFLFIFIGCLIYFIVNEKPVKLLNDLRAFNIYIPLFGFITAIAYSFYFGARRALPLGLFGLLGYVEPMLLTLVSILFLHESLTSSDIASYGFIWFSVIILAGEAGIYALKALKRKRKLR